MVELLHTEFHNKRTKTVKNFRKSSKTHERKITHFPKQEQQQNLINHLTKLRKKRSDSFVQL